MTAEAGLAALWLAAALAAAQVALAALGLAGRWAFYAPMAAVRPVAIVQGAMAGLAMALLIAAFLQSDMSVALVAENSHPAEPWLSEFSGAWRGREGSLLLWVAILAVAGSTAAWFERRLDDRTLIAALGSQGLIALGFYALTLFSSNPFARIGPSPTDGSGPATMLENSGPAFFPLVLAAGYASLLVAFSFALGALATCKVGPTLARAVRPWVLGAWVLLTLAITSRSYWTYRELDQAAYWLWNSVETGFLTPWLAATALLHSTPVLGTRAGLRAWTVLLAIALIGTLWLLAAERPIGSPFQRAVSAVALLPLALAGVGPLLRWRRDDTEAVLERLTWPIAAALFTAAGLFAFNGWIGAMPLLSLAIAAGVAVASVVPLVGRAFRRTQLCTWGMVVAHLGVAVSLAGMASEAAFTAERRTAVRAGEAVFAGPYGVTLEGITPRIGRNWSALEAHLTARRGDMVGTLRPQVRYFSNPATSAGESAILTAPDGQLYAVLGEPDETGRWPLRLWWKPYVTLIWAGGALIAFGGTLSLIGRVRRGRQAGLRG